MKSDIIKQLTQLNKLYFNNLDNKSDITEEWNYKADELKKTYHNVKSLVILRLDAIGDCLLFTNSLRQIRELFPSAHISYMCYIETKQIIDRCKYIDAPIYIDRKQLESNKTYREKLYAKILELKFDLLINPLYSREFLAEEIVYFLNAEIKIGFEGDTSNISKTILNITNKWYDVILKIEAVENKFELYRNAELVKLLGGTSNPKELPELWNDKKDKNYIEKVISNLKLEDYAIVFPGTKGGKNSIKYWGSENFARITDYIYDKLNLNVVILAGNDEEEICNDIAVNAKSKPVILQGQFSIWESVELLRKAKFYFGSDTSIAHFAATLKIPTFVVLGGGHFKRFFPYPDHNHVKAIYRKLDCYNCNWQCTQTTNKCIKDITVNEVKEKLYEHIFNQNKIEKPKESKNKININKHIGSQPQIDLLLPPSNLHSWHLKEGILNHFRILGSINRVFYFDNNQCDHFFKYLEQGSTSDLFLAIGGDHHLHFLHDTPQKIELWNKVNKEKVCYSYESTLESIYPFYKTSALNAAKVFSHFLVADENDVSFFEQIGKKAIWFPQFADERFFVNFLSFEERKNKVFFKGKLWSEYKQRQKLLSSLADAKLIDIVEKFLTNGQLVEGYNENIASINPPGVFGGFNVRTFEALACGSLLFQFLPPNRPMNNRLFEHGKHLIYFDTNNTGLLKDQIREVLRDPVYFKSIAENGHQEVIENHTLTKRMNTLLDWVLFGKQPVYPKYEPVTAKKISQKIALELTTQNNFVSGIKVSAIVSVYNSEKFIEGCLLNLVGQTLFKKNKLEIVIVNSGSEQDEEKIINKFLNKYENIKYIRTENRETIYSSWNRGISAASGKYITNANTDDRHREDALELLSDILDNDEKIDVVYSDQHITTKPNDFFGSQTATKIKRWSDFDKDLLLFGCFIGPQPMWRKSLHTKFGYFQDQLKVVGDYEFWLRISHNAKFHHLAEPLGLYFYSEQSAEHRNKTLTEDENYLVQNHYLSIYIANEDYLKSVEKKINLLAAGLNVNKYIVQARELLKKRKDGLSVELEMIKFFQELNTLGNEEVIDKAAKFLEMVLNAKIIINKNQYYETLNSLLAAYYLKCNQKDKAQNCYEEILKTNSCSSIACEGLGILFYNDGEPEAAKTMLEWAVKNDPNNATAVEALKQANQTLSLPENHNSLFENAEVQIANES